MQSNQEARQFIQVAAWLLIYRTDYIFTCIAIIKMLTFIKIKLITLTFFKFL